MGEARIGLIGLGTMGAALAMNIAEKGFRIAVWNRTSSVTQDFHSDAGDLADRIVPTRTLSELVDAIAAPRTIILMVPAGQPVDEQLEALSPLLGADDLVIDAGNADFHDTTRRANSDLPFGFMGMGVSGGEDGARHGPSIMAGGTPEQWDRVAPVLTAIAAKAEDGTACAARMGVEGAGHFVKMVHNGIEYADMQMIAEIYGLMRDGMTMDAAAISKVFDGWNDGPLQSYLIEISAKVTAAKDPHGDTPMVDMILDRAGQKGTGRWTAIEAQHLAAPIPVIEAAVMARNVSARLEDRRAGEDRFGAAPGPCDFDPATMEQALIAGKILCYAQGFSMIAAASDKFDWSLPLPEIARIWRAGCIIRSAMLNDMADALADHPDRNLVMAPHFAELVEAALPTLRQIVSQGLGAGHALPALANGLMWFDMMRTARGTANMIQAQRDFFGAHGFERTDGNPDKHGPWGA
jgi:6-phosphogluconate dehydrogenase